MVQRSDSRGDASPEDILGYLAANVRRRRGKLGWTQKQLAEKLDVALRYLQRIEGGKVNVGLVALARLAEALGVPPGLLIRKATLPEVRVGRPKGKGSAEGAG